MDLYTENIPAGVIILGKSTLVTGVEGLIILIKGTSL